MGELNPKDIGVEEMNMHLEDFFQCARNPSMIKRDDDDFCEDWHDEAENWAYIHTYIYIRLKIKPNSVRF